MWYGIASILYFPYKKIIYSHSKLVVPVADKSFHMFVGLRVDIPGGAGRCDPTKWTFKYLAQSNEF